MDLESSIATELLVCTIKKIKFPSPSCQNLEAGPNLGKMSYWRIGPLHILKTSWKISAYFRENKSRKFLQNSTILDCYRNFSLPKKLKSTELSVSYICSKYQWDTLIRRGFMEVWNFWFHWPCTTKMASHRDSRRVPWRKKGEKLQILTYPTRATSLEFHDEDLWRQKTRLARPLCALFAWSYI